MPLLKLVIGSFMCNEFVTLNASARSSNFCVSRNWNVLESAVSNCQVPGPRMLLAANSSECAKGWHCESCRIEVVADGFVAVWIRQYLIHALVTAGR